MAGPSDPTRLGVLEPAEDLSPSTSILRIGVLVVGYSDCPDPFSELVVQRLGPPTPYRSSWRARTYKEAFDWAANACQSRAYGESRRQSRPVQLDELVLVGHARPGVFSLSGAESINARSTSALEPLVSLLRSGYAHPATRVVFAGCRVGHGPEGLSFLRAAAGVLGLPTEGTTIVVEPHHFGPVGLLPSVHRQRAPAPVRGLAGR